MQEGSKAQESKSEFKDLKINSEDSVQDFQDLESVLNSFEIDDSKKKKPKLRRNTLASSMKFWRTRIDFTWTYKLNKSFTKKRFLFLVR